MELKDTFTVEVPPERLWEVLTDVEQIAPCVPGFELEEVDEPDYRGKMKIKVGAIQMTYDATITFAERDDAARRAVLKVKGKERRGPGAVDATTTATLSGGGGQTTAEMVTEVQVTGRIAQFGRGIIADVSTRLTEKFVDNLEQQVLAPGGSAAAATADVAGGSAIPSGAGGGAAGNGGEAEGAEPAVNAAEPAAQSASEPQPTSPPAAAKSQSSPPPAAEPLDLAAVSAVPVLKRVAPVAIVAVLAFLLLRWRSR